MYFMCGCRQLQKQRTRHVGSMIVRDSLRTEMTKQRDIGEDLREKQAQLSIDIDVLNVMIGRSEELMVQQRKRFEEETQKRNDRYDGLDWTDDTRALESTVIAASAVRLSA